MNSRIKKIFKVVNVNERHILYSKTLAEVLAPFFGVSFQDFMTLAQERSLKALPTSPLFFSLFFSHRKECQAQRSHEKTTQRHKVCQGDVGSQSTSKPSNVFPKSVQA